MQLLLDQRANVNAQSGVYGNALQAASYKGHEQIVQLLLDKEATPLDDSNEQEESEEDWETDPNEVSLDSEEELESIPD